MTSEELSLGPGVYPFESGIYEGMYSKVPWKIMQYSGYGTAEQANLNFKRILSSGGTGISIAFDLPTQMGISPTSEIGKYEIGKVGVSINTLDDMRTLLSGIDLKAVTVSMTINATAGILLLMLQIVAEENGFDSKSLRGTIQNDILKEFIARNTFIFPPDFSLDFTCFIFEYCQKELPLWNPISISGYHFAEAGASPVQEVGFAISNALEYLSIAQNYDLDLEVLASKFTFFFSVKTNLFEEICKLRAARRVWATIMKEKYNFGSKKPLAMKIHAQTAGVQLTANDVENNHARITIQAVAAVLGGVQSLHTNSHNEALSLPTENASNIAINLQNIMLEETDLTKYPDPLNGSKLITDLTNELFEKIRLKIDQIESLGGAKSAVKLGFQKSEIEKESYLEFMKIEKGSKKIIGINSGAKLASTNSNQNLYFDLPKDLQEYSSETKSAEDNLSAEVDEFIELLRNKVNFMWKLKDLLKKGITVTEICEILVTEFGRYQSEI